MTVSWLTPITIGMIRVVASQQGLDGKFKNDSSMESGSPNLAADSKNRGHQPGGNSATDKDADGDGSSSVALIVGLSVLGVVVLVVMVTIGLVMYRRRKAKRGFELLQQTLADESNTLSFGKLKLAAAEVIGSQEAAERVISKIADETAEDRDIESGAIKPMDTPVRYSFIKIRTETQVVLGVGKKKFDSKKGAGGHQQIPPSNTKLLHMSKMRDYNGDSILVCQAPLPDQFADQWRALWQERVGLVVWIGSLEEDGEKKIDTYVPLREHHKMEVANFVIQTAAVVRRPHEFDQYLVRVHKTRIGRKRTKSRELIFIHAHFWPDHSAPMVPAKLADFIERLSEHHARAVGKGLRSMLMHCSAGVQRSPALATVYIGFQIWTKNHRINMIGLLRYIRYHRYKSFGLGNAVLQVQIVYGIMQILATRIDFHEKTGVKRQRARGQDVIYARMRAASITAKQASGSGSGSTTDSSSLRP